MQTFIPEPDYIGSVAVLDNKRLGKQRVETLQIMNVLAGLSKGWVNHPAVKMWRGHEYGLLLYQVATCNEWTGRGYKDTCLDKTTAVFDSNFSRPNSEYNPEWWGDYRVHASHRSNLLRKDPDHYRQYWPEDSDKLEYYWPV
jgi:hypothetical protein